MNYYVKYWDWSTMSFHKVGVVEDSVSIGDIVPYDFPTLVVTQSYK